MSIMEKAQSHYKGLLDGDLRPISIPEWDTEAFIKPSLSLQRLGEIMECANGGNPAEAMALTVIYRLVDADGKPLFRKSDKTELLKSLSPDVITNIVTAINELDPSSEDIEGN